MVIILRRWGTGERAFSSPEKAYRAILRNEVGFPPASVKVVGERISWLTLSQFLRGVEKNISPTLS